MDSNEYDDVEMISDDCVWDVLDELPPTLCRSEVFAGAVLGLGRAGVGRRVFNEEEAPDLLLRSLLGTSIKILPRWSCSCEGSRAESEVEDKVPDLDFLNESSDCARIASGGASAGSL